jgi:osmotically-inducible protein OsmY
MSPALETAMVLRFQTSEGHEDSSTRASVESALSAAHDLNAEEIVVVILGSYVILEGFVRRKGDAERAVEIAEDVVGKGYVRSRILRR